MLMCIDGHITYFSLALIYHNFDHHFGNHTVDYTHHLYGAGVDW